MARSFNQFNGLGNLAADPEVRDLGSSGRQVCKLRVMFNNSYKRGEETVEESFGVDVNVFGDQQVKYLSDFARKGDKVLIDGGRLKISKYERRDGAGEGWSTEIVVGPFNGNVSILTTKKEREEREGGGGGRDRGDDRGGYRDDDRGGRGGGGGGRGRSDDRGGYRDDDRGGYRDDDRGGRGGGGGRSGGGNGGSFGDALDDDVPF